jgi:hypothetical protein
MTGHGGGGYSPRDSGCANLSFNTVLGSPKLTVLATLRVGHVLELELMSMPTKIVAAKTSAGNVAGTITTQVPKLIECIENGSSFEAEVTQITGPQCNVLVRPK